MIHVLISTSSRTGLADELRAVAPQSTVFLPESGLDETLERLSRSSRIDAVVTDDPAVAAAIREEIPGALPVHVATDGEAAVEIWRRLAPLFE